MNQDDVIVESLPNGGLQCKIICPECKEPRTLSSSVNEATGKSSFSVYNFTRHFKTHQIAPPNSQNESRDDQTCTGCSALHNSVAQKEAVISELNRQLETTVQQHSAELNNLLLEKNTLLMKYESVPPNDCQQPCAVCTELTKKIQELSTNNKPCQVEGDVTCEERRERLIQALREKNATISDYEARLSDVLKNGAQACTNCFQLSGIVSQKNAIIDDLGHRLNEMQHKHESEKNELVNQMASMNNDLKQEIDRLKVELAGAEKMKIELQNLRRIHIAKHKMFKIKLCSIEPITNTYSIQLQDEAIKFTGK